MDKSNSLFYLIIFCLDDSTQASYRFFFVTKVFMRSWHGVDIFFCGTTETSFEQMVNIIFRLFVKLNALC